MRRRDRKRTGTVMLAAALMLLLCGMAPASRDSAETEAETGAEVEAETESSKLTVVIDPGHQGREAALSGTEPLGPGSSEMKAKTATGTQGRYTQKPEYELDLEISVLLRGELEARGYRVVMTREDHDTAISNIERAQLAWEEGGDIFIRIHANGSDNESIKGALAMVPSPSNPYVSDLSPDSFLLGQCVLDSYCKRADFESLGVQYYDAMSGMNWSRIPVMILEMGFMTNQSDDLRMADAQVQEQMALGIADGIDRYFTEKGKKTMQATEEQQAAADACLERIRTECFASGADGGSWRISLEDLNTYAAGNIGGTEQISAAGMIRLFLMGTVYDRICYPSSEERHIFFNERYEGELKQLITAMIAENDREASEELLVRLGEGSEENGMAAVNQFCRENGYTGTVMGQGFTEEDPAGENLTTAEDCRKFAADLFRGVCVGPEASAKMYAYLRDQAFPDMIPQETRGGEVQTAGLAEEFSGEDGGRAAGNRVVVTQAGDKAYVLCIFGAEESREKIRKISEIVYEELTR